MTSQIKTKKVGFQASPSGIVKKGFIWQSEELKSWSIVESPQKKNHLLLVGWLCSI